MGGGLCSIRAVLQSGPCSIRLRHAACQRQAVLLCGQLSAVALARAASTHSLTTSAWQVPGDQESLQVVLRKDAQAGLMRGCRMALAGTPGPTPCNDPGMHKERRVVA